MEKDTPQADKHFEQDELEQAFILLEKRGILAPDVSDDSERIMASYDSNSHDDVSGLDYAEFAEAVGASIHPSNSAGLVVL